jgi:hypothetical protein
VLVSKVRGAVPDSEAMIVVPEASMIWLGIVGRPETRFGFRPVN